MKPIKVSKNGEVREAHNRTIFVLSGMEAAGWREVVEQPQDVIEAANKAIAEGNARGQNNAFINLMVATEGNVLVKEHDLTNGVRAAAQVAKAELKEEQRLVAEEEAKQTAPAETPAESKPESNSEKADSLRIAKTVSPKKKRGPAKKKP